MNDTTRPALAASTALSTPTVLTLSMTGLVREHAAARHAANAEEGDTSHPMNRYHAACDAISAARCNSIPDMLAKLQAAQLEAGAGYDADAQELDTSPAGRWAWQVCMDLERLLGRTPVGTDAQLLTLAAEFTALAQREQSLFGDGPGAIKDDTAREKVLSPIFARMSEIDRALDGVRAKTIAGLLARVGMLKAYKPQGPDETADQEEILGWEIAWDVLALFGAPDATLQSPDTKLLALIGRYNDLMRQVHQSYEARPDDISNEQEEQLDLTEIEPLKNAQRPLLDRICRTKAKTAEGILARIEMLHIESPHLLHAKSYKDERVLGALIRDALTIAGKPVPRRKQPERPKVYAPEPEAAATTSGNPLLRHVIENMTVGEVAVFIDAVGRLADGPLLGTDDMSKEERLRMTVLTEAYRKTGTVPA